MTKQMPDAEILTPMTVESFTWLLYNINRPEVTDAIAVYTRCHDALAEAQREVEKLKKLASCDHGVEWDTDCPQCIKADRVLALLVRKALLKCDADEIERLKGENQSLLKRAEEAEKALTAAATRVRDMEVT